MGAAAIPRSHIGRFAAGRKAPKVFAIGFNKTGTTSLHRIFQDLGYHSYHGTKWRNTSQHLFYRFYDAFCDGIPDNFRKLDEMFPKARFILQVRDLDTWLDSRIDHILRLPGGKNRSLGWTAHPEAVASWVKKRDAHHIEVLRYFADRPRDILVVNFIREPDSATRIAGFLGHSEPVEKPHANRNPMAGKALQNGDMIASVLNSLGVPEMEWKNDIHCPSLMHDATSIPADTKVLRGT